MRSQSPHNQVTLSRRDRFGYLKLALAAMLFGAFACGTTVAPNTAEDVKDIKYDKGSVDLGDEATPTDNPCPDDICDDDAVVPEADAEADAQDVLIDTYTGILCSTNGACKSESPDTPFCNPVNHQCVECLFNGSCKPGFLCDENKKCIDVNCKPGSQICNGPNLKICNDDGKSYTDKSCPNNLPYCAGGECLKCVAKKKYCGKDDPTSEAPNQVMQCSDDGATSKVVHKCSEGQVCLNEKCVVCQAGLKKCDIDQAMICAPDGLSWQLADDCGLKNFACQGGICVDPCDPDFKSNTNVGCDYFAVDLDNAYVPNGSGGYYDAQNSQFSVIVSNTRQKSATVKVTAGTGQSKSYTVAPNGLKILNLPDPTWKDPATGQPLKPLNQDGTSVNKNVYRIQSDQPIVAYQFNPLQNYDVFSNDASLLLPSNAVGYEYYVITREQTVELLRSYYTIVAVSHGHTVEEKAKKKTHITITSSTDTLAGPGIKAMKVGETQEFDLLYGQVLNIETNCNGCDPTGTFIHADLPIAVFGGSEASNSPNTDHCKGGKCEFQGWACTTNADCPITCCSDHMEEQLFPTTSWGTQYVATKLQPRGQEKDSWRIVALHNGTVVNTSPPQTSGAINLEEGQWIEFESDQDFIITSNDAHPIQVGQFMAAAFAPDPNKDTCTGKFAGQKVCSWFWNVKQQPLDCNKNADCPNIPEPTDAKTGDPDFELSIATTLYLDNYVFLVPGNYLSNYINVIAPTEEGTVVKLDTIPIPKGAFKPIGGGWAVARQPIGSGVHNLTSNKLVGLLVYGWADFVSYGYPGGTAVPK